MSLHDNWLSSLTIFCIAISCFYLLSLIWEAHLHSLSFYHWFSQDRSQQQLLFLFLQHIQNIFCYRWRNENWLYFDRYIQKVTKFSWFLLGYMTKYALLTPIFILLYYRILFYWKEDKKKGRGLDVKYLNSYDLYYLSWSRNSRIVHSFYLFKLVFLYIILIHLAISRFQLTFPPFTLLLIYFYLSYLSYFLPIIYVSLLNYL